MKKRPFRLGGQVGGTHCGSVSGQVGTYGHWSDVWSTLAYSDCAVELYVGKQRQVYGSASTLGVTEWPCPSGTLRGIDLLLWKERLKEGVR